MNSLGIPVGGRVIVCSLTIFCDDGETLFDTARSGVQNIESGPFNAEMIMISTIRVQIDELAPNGAGVAIHPDKEGWHVHVPGGAPGDVLDVQAVHHSHPKKVVFAEERALIERGDSARRAPCVRTLQRGGRCGGCPMMHIEPGAQRAAKARWVSETLGPVWSGAVEVAAVGEETRYRNRGHFVASIREERIILGAYAPRSHDVILVGGCRVLREPIADVADHIAEVATLRRLPAGTREGALRYVTIRSNPAGKCIVDLVVRSGAAWARDFIDLLLEDPRIVGASLSVNDSEKNALRTNASNHIAGMKTLDEPIGELVVRAGAETFLQLNSAVAEAAYAQAAAWLSGGSGVLWDLYCGVGSIGLVAAASQPNWRIYGVESSRPSIAEATRLGGAKHTFVCADLHKGLPADAPSPDAIIVNPPRRGLDAAVRKRLCKGGCNTIVYMSCNPSSLLRDVTHLRDAGWKLTALQGYDMLPNTTHVEVLARLERDPAS